MELYFSPLACSLATRIALYEAGADARFIAVDATTKRTEDGRDFRTIHPLSLVPALRGDDGELLLESAAILQWVAARFPEAALAPAEPRQRAQLQQWLSFIGTELHKAVFVPLLDPKAPEGAKSYALSHAASRLAVLEQQLDGRDFLLDRFSVADAYLGAILNWTRVTPVDLEPFPRLRAYQARLLGRPAVARAMSEEFSLYQSAQR